ncbi:LPXTG cell wall anchor domain-containing protein [Rothia sp. 88186D007BW]
MSRATFKVVASKSGAVVATGLVASSIFASMPASNAVDTGSFGSVISASEAESTTRSVVVDNSALLKAVEEARSAGITVNEDEIKKISVGSTAEIDSALSSISADHQSQAAALQALITEYSAAKAQAEADHKKALEEWESLKAENDTHNAALKDEYDAKVSKYKQDLAAYEAKAAAYQKLIEALENNGDVNTEEFLAQCRPQNLAVVIDVTWSFSAGDLATQVEAQRAFLQKMSKLPGTTVDLYIYGNIGGVGKPDYDSWTPDLATQNFNISTPEGLAAANAVLDTITNERRNTNDDFSWFSSGTNWEAGLRDVLNAINNSGRNYTNVIFSSDGAPNKTLSDNGDWEDTGTPGYSQEAADEALRYANEILDKGIKITPVFVRSAEDYLSIIQLDQREPGTLQLALDAIGKLSGAENPELGKDYFSAETMDGLTGDLWRAAVADCSPANNPKPVPPTEPDYNQIDAPAPEPVTVPAPVGTYQLTDLSAPIPVVEKVAKDEGKKVIAGETTTQTISYATGYQAPESFILGDHIYFTEDGRMPVSVNMNEVAVTDAEGNNVTDQFTITSEDGVHNGKAGHQILATAKDPGSLKLNTSYTLHVNQTSLFDGIADTLIDSGFAIVNDELQFTADKTYYEPKINPDKTVVNSEGVEVDNTRVLPGQELNYPLTLSAADLADTTSEVTKLGKYDNYDETKWAPTGEFTVVDSEGNTVSSDQFTDEWNLETGEVTILAKNPAELVGKDYTITLLGHVKQDATPGEFTNQATQLTNEDKTLTKVVRNYVPVIAPSKVDTSATDGSNIDGKAVTVGDVISYKLVEDTTNLENTADTIKVSGMVDDFDERYGQIDASQVRVYQVPGDTDTSTPEAVSAAVKLDSAKDVTDSYTITNGEVEGFTNGGAVGISSMMKTDGEGKVVLPMGYKYIHVLPYTVTANADGDILNTAWQVTNDHRTQTETVANKLKEINPTKDVVINVGDGDSIDGTEIALNTVFNYELNSSTLPADRAGATESWSIVDDWDESKDAYEGNFKVLSQHSFVDENGAKVDAGEDITRYFTQKVENGVVTYEATDAFLELMSSEANRATEQGFSVYMQVERIGTGEVENTFVENYNGEELTSNTVKTFTPEPVVPVTPENPGTPDVTTPSTPAVVKGEGAKAGGEATVAGIPVNVLLAGGGVLLTGLIGLGTWALVAGARKKNS